MSLHTEPPYRVRLFIAGRQTGEVRTLENESAEGAFRLYRERLARMGLPGHVSLSVHGMIRDWWQVE